MLIKIKTNQLLLIILIIIKYYYYFSKYLINLSIIHYTLHYTLYIQTLNNVGQHVVQLLVYSMAFALSGRVNYGRRSAFPGDGEKC